MTFLLVLVLASTSDQADVLAAVEKLSVAYRWADADTLGALITEDYIHTNSSGEVLDRERWLRWVRTGVRQTEFETYQNSDLAVRIHGKTAIVTGLHQSSGTRDGKAFALRLRFTQVWVKTKDGWKRAAFQDTAAR